MSGIVSRGRTLNQNPNAARPSPCFCHKLLPFPQAPPLALGPTPSHAQSLPHVSLAAAQLCARLKPVCDPNAASCFSPRVHGPMSRPLHLSQAQSGPFSPQDPAPRARWPCLTWLPRCACWRAKRSWGRWTRAASGCCARCSGRVRWPGTRPGSARQRPGACEVSAALPGVATSRAPRML